MFLMKMLALLLILLTSIVSAENKLARKIESISYRSQLGATVALITLTDGSVWKWTPDTYSENLLRKWTEGDEVTIRVIHHPGFVLQNLTKPHYTPTVALTFNSYLLFPSLAKCYNGDGIIELSDGSKWELLYDFNLRTLHHWTLGDRIIPVKGSQGNFELINLDIPFESRSCIERYIEVFPHSPSVAVAS
ncbi:MAG: hypothetical protein K1000chlam2_00585 [Chlamydiae bacterium]|nr:hypothetical protein [Chlamydiota bacterium]